MQIELTVVNEYAKEVWRVADSIADIRLDGTFLQGSSACEGTDLAKGFAAHAHAQHLAVQALATECDDFGTALKSAANDFARQEDKSVQSIASLTKSRRV